MKDKILQFLMSREDLSDVVDVARHIYNKRDISEQEYNAVGRILYQLYNQGFLNRREGTSTFFLSKYSIKRATRRNNLETV